MATNLSKLRVSLTKHGAHKVAALLERYPARLLLSKVKSNTIGVNIELAQAKANLAVGDDGKLPMFWGQAKDDGQKTIRALVLLGIIFAHHKLISAMTAASSGTTGKGIVKRGAVISAKSYTNFANDLDELGFSIEHTKEKVEFDLSPIFRAPNVNRYFRDLLTRKLAIAGWKGTTSLEDEATRLGLHNALCVSKTRFVRWLKAGIVDGEHAGNMLDSGFFTNASDAARTHKPFRFVAGHKPKKTGRVSVAPSKEATTADLLHNAIQTALFKKLAKTHKKSNVATEVPTGWGTAIDLVVKNGRKYWLYEIKTDPSVRGCIRQAIPQLLEYAYWDGKPFAERLIIVGTSRITKEADSYLAFLRATFGLNFEYEHFDVATV